MELPKCIVFELDISVENEEGTTLVDGLFKKTLLVEAQVPVLLSADFKVTISIGLLKRYTNLADKLSTLP